MANTSTTTKKPKLAALAKFRKQGGRICGVCSNPHRRFIEQAFKAGHSKRAIREYFQSELGIVLPTLNHHLDNHMDKES